MKMKPFGLNIILYLFTFFSVHGIRALLSYNSLSFPYSNLPPLMQIQKVTNLEFTIKKSYKVKMRLIKK